MAITPPAAPWYWSPSLSIIVASIEAVVVWAMFNEVPFFLVIAATTFAGYAFIESGGVLSATDDRPLWLITLCFFQLVGLLFVLVYIGRARISSAELTDLSVWVPVTAALMTGAVLLARQAVQ